MRTIVLTGGGTAGHIMPNIALIEELKKYYDRIIYIGGDGMEKRIAEKNNLQYFRTDVVKFTRDDFIKNFKIPFVLIKGIREAKALLSTLRPSVIFSKGGYVALPTCFAAYFKKIPIVVHESDFTLGVANKLVSRFAKSTLTSFSETKGGEYVGNPIRACITQGNKDIVVKRHKLAARQTILVMGGSLGSEALNKVIYQAVATLTKTYNVIHLAGKSLNDKIAYKNYHQLEFAEDIENYFAAADLVVSRAGANSLSEIAALGLRNIVIPLPKGNSRGDQLENAESYSKRGLVEILRQENLTCASLLSAIEVTMEKPKPKSTDYADTIVKIVNKIREVDKEFNK